MAIFVCSIILAILLIIEALNDFDNFITIVYSVLLGIPVFLIVMFFLYFVGAME